MNTKSDYDIHCLSCLASCENMMMQAYASMPNRSLKPDTPLDRSTSEPSLLSRQQSEVLSSAPVKSQRRSLLSRLRRSKAEPDSLLGRTVSDTSLLTRQSSGDQSQGSSVPSKRKSLFGLLRKSKSSSKAASAAAAALTCAESMAGTQQEQSPTEGVSPGRTSSLRDDGTEPIGKSVSIPLEPKAGSGVESLQQSTGSEALESQSAPASPRGRARAPPVLIPQGSLSQPDLASGRAASEGSMLSHRPSGMHTSPTTPRRMSMLGRLSRVRRSNSIVPEPSTAEGTEQQELPQEEVPFAEQPFAEQPFTEQPYAEQPSTDKPAVVESMADQSLGECAVTKQPFAKNLNRQAHTADHALLTVDADLPLGAEALPIITEGQPTDAEPMPSTNDSLPTAGMPAASADQRLHQLLSAEHPPATGVLAGQLSHADIAAELPSAEQASEGQLAEERPSADEYSSPGLEDSVDDTQLDSAGSYEKGKPTGQKACFRILVCSS